METSVLFQKQMENSSNLTASIWVHYFTFRYADTYVTFTCVMI